MRFGNWYLVYIISILIFPWRLTARTAIDITPEQKTFLEKFRLVNEEGIDAPPAEFRQGCFSGVVLELGKEISHPPMGTATHFGRYVITSAHVVPDRRHPEKYFIVYFDHAGRKAYSRVLSISEFDAKNDLAILELPKSTQGNWASANPTPSPLQLSTTTVFALAADPLDLRDDVLAKMKLEGTTEGGERGAVLQKKTGVLSSNAPGVSIEGENLDRAVGKRIKFSPLYWHRGNRKENLEIFVGNSGTVLFSGNGTPQGVLSRGLMVRTDQEISEGVRPIRMSARSAAHYGIVSPLRRISKPLGESCSSQIAKKSA